MKIVFKDGKYRTLKGETFIINQSGISVKEFDTYDITHYSWKEINSVEAEEARLIVAPKLTAEQIKEAEEVLMKADMSVRFITCETEKIEIHTDGCCPYCGAEINRNREV